MNAGDGVHLSHCVSPAPLANLLPLHLFEYELVQKTVAVIGTILLINITKTWLRNWSKSKTNRVLWLWAGTGGSRCSNTGSRALSLTLGSMWFYVSFISYPLEKEMAARSSTLAWKIPWTEEAGGLQSMGPQRVGHDRATSFSLSLSCNEKNHQQYIFKLSSLLTNSKG